VAVGVLFEGKTISVSDGSFRDSFAQDDVHIYHVYLSNVYIPAVYRTNVHNPPAGTSIDGSRWVMR
jgi:hypothetical protein